MNDFNFTGTQKPIANTLKKAVFLLAACTVLLMSCQSADNNNTNKAEQPAVTDSHHDQEAAAALSLNNGMKWKADSVTNQNVSALKSVINNANPATLESYQAAGKELQAGITKMISECRMKGADHDALHQWLEPLLETNKKLQEAQSVADGAVAFDLIKKQIHLYSDFFE